jgi:Putative Flp pilus-assembly TadE/G-like
VKSRHRESGQALVAATFGLVVLLGCAGLAVDVGYLRYQQRLQQSAADSAAIAGAAESAAGNATAAAREDALLNGYTNGVNNVTVTVNPAFPFGAVTGVQVQVSAVHPTFFMRIFGVNNATVSTTAVAIDNSAKNCVYALNGFGTAINNNATVTATGCGIMDDGNLLNTGRITASSVGVHGTAAGGATIPAAITGIVEAGDPLYRLTAPGSGGGCTTEVISNTMPAQPPAIVTLTPRKYCSITVTGNRNVTLSAGTYVITQGGGLSLNGTGTISGNDVTIYLSPGAGPVAINNLPGSSQTLQLIAPTTGALAGILFFQDRANAQAATINGRGTSKLQGTLYFPDATLNLSNTGNSAAYSLAVAKTLTLTGTVDFASNFTSLPAGSPIQNAVLVE